MEVFLTGASGELGTSLVPTLVERGHDVVGLVRDEESAATVRDLGGRPHRGDVTDPETLSEGVADAEVVVHAASAPTGETEAVDVRGTEHLLEAATAADVHNVVYVSIVGIDEIPYSYYQHKLRAEELVADSPVPSTIVRVTQFHEFVHGLLSSIGRLPIWPLPTDFRIQPIAVDEAATAIAEHATPDAAGRVPEVGGPEVHTVRDLAEAYRDLRGSRRPIVRVPIPGGTAAAFEQGEATCPDRTVGTTTWADWLREGDR